MTACEQQELSFTGERFMTECKGEIWYEHWHRYAFAAPFVKGLRVVDVASGEGYGSSHLATHAAHVVGIDISEQAVAHANRRYADKKNLKYVTASCDAIPLSTNSVDVVTSFETIEHIQNQAEMIEEIQRVLKPDGLLIISSPDKKTYSDDRSYQNEHHIKELYNHEFQTLLAGYFPYISQFGQRVVCHSAIWPLDAPICNLDLQLGEEGSAPEAVASIDIEPLYHIALCSMQEVATHSDLSLFADTNQSVYHTFEFDTRHRLRLDADLIEHMEMLTQRDKTINERDETIHKREKDIVAYAEQIKRHEAMVSDRDALISELDFKKNEAQKTIAALNTHANQLTELAEYRRSWRWWVKLPWIRLFKGSI
ncbi:MAG: class I SAM-dependent methyltransferase [Mariprofundaceae bacterium]